MCDCDLVVIVNFDRLVVTLNPDGFHVLIALIIIANHPRMICVIAS